MNGRKRLLDIIIVRLVQKFLNLPNRFIVRHEIAYGLNSILYWNVLIAILYYCNTEPGKKS